MVTIYIYQFIIFIQTLKPLEAEVQVSDNSLSTSKNLIIFLLIHMMTEYGKVKVFDCPQ